jgi:hypothetical protein
MAAAEVLLPTRMRTRDAVGRCISSTILWTFGWLRKARQMIGRAKKIYGGEAGGEAGRGGGARQGEEGGRGEGVGGVRCATGPRVCMCVYVFVCKCVITQVGAR